MKKSDLIIWLFALKKELSRHTEIVKVKNTKSRLFLILFWKGKPYFPFPIDEKLSLRVEKFPPKDIESF